MPDAGNDRWLDLIERFAARGARISVGNLSQCMIEHLLNVVEEQDVRIRGLEDALRRREPPPSVPPIPDIGEIKPE